MEVITEANSQTQRRIHETQRRIGGHEVAAKVI
jgi:hypothetical protein